MDVGHVIERTSPKGEKFIGKCALCGMEGLTTADVLKEKCPIKISAEEFIKVVFGEK